MKIPSIFYIRGSRRSSKFLYSLFWYDISFTHLTRAYEKMKIVWWKTSGKINKIENGSKQLWNIRKCLGAINLIFSSSLSKQPFVWIITNKPFQCCRSTHIHSSSNPFNFHFHFSTRWNSICILLAMSTPKNIYPQKLLKFILRILTFWAKFWKLWNKTPHFPSFALLIPAQYNK